MSRKIMRRIGAACAALVMGVSAIGFVGCDSGYPEATITYNFNNEDYAIRFKLYRKLYPQTVKHFIELADAGYYDNTVVHDYDYTSARFVCGAYEADETSSTRLKEKDYFTFAQTLMNNGKFTPTVYSANGDPLCTLYGEFSGNGYSVKSGDISETFGSLTMYYYGEKEDKTMIRYKSSSTGEVSSVDDLKFYNYNCATSVFYLKTASVSSAADTTHVTFALLANDNESENLQNFLDAITDYTEELKEEHATDDLGEYFFKSTKVGVDSFDPYYGSEKHQQTFNVLLEPITIKSVKINKY